MTWGQINITLKAALNGVLGIPNVDFFFRGVGEGGREAVAEDTGVD